jgi:hypothetical protein
VLCHRYRFHRDLNPTFDLISFNYSTVDKKYNRDRFSNYGVGITRFRSGKRFGLAGKELWSRLEPLRVGPASRDGFVPVRPELVAGVKFFGRYRSGAIRDGVLLSVGRLNFRLATARIKIHLTSILKIHKI